MQIVAFAKTIFFVLWFFLSCQVERSQAGKRAKKSDDDSSKVGIPHHSFQTPLAYEQVLNDWSVSGASLVETDRLLIHPSVSERAGFFFNTAPLLTNDFEVIIHFRVIGEKAAAKVALDQSFSVWYVYENISAAYNETKLIKANSWKDGLDELGMTFAGMRSKFTGLGAILSMGDAAKKPKPVMTGVWNDGDRDLVYGVDAPGIEAKAVDFRNTLNAAQMRIRVTPTSVEGSLKQSPSLSWTECFKLDRTSNPVKAGGYLGFTAWSGQAASDVIPDMISVSKFEVFNYDTTSIGEEMKDVTKEIQDAYREMLTDENRHFADQKSQTEHLGRIVGMLSQHIETNKPADTKMFEDLELIQGRMQRLDEDCKTLVKELQILVEPKDGSSADNHSLKDEIIGLRSLLVSSSAAHNQKLDVVRKNVAEVKKKHEDSTKPEVFDAMHKQTESMENTVNQRSSQMTWMMVIIIVSIAAVGALMYNRMSYYEKRHFI